jgi:hypothetical protein
MPVGLGGEQGWWCPSITDQSGDISGNGNGGTYQGGMGTVADTGSGGVRAYYFDGFNDYITTTFDSMNGPTNGIFSMSAWYNLDSTFATTAIMSGNLQTSRTGLTLMFDAYSAARGNRGLINPNIPGVYTGICEGGDRDATSISTWYHLSYTGDGSNAFLYLNGSQIDTAVINQSTAVAWNQDMHIGAYTTGFGSVGGLMNGMIDDCRVYDRTITQEEITHLATARGVLGPPGGDNFNAFTNAKYVTRQFSNQRFG